MKRRLTTYLMLAIACLSFHSCLFQEDDVFEDSAANRATAAVNEYTALLQSAPNGWLLEYYIGEDYASGGVPIFCKFSADKVEMAAAFDAPDAAAGTRHTSLYQVTAEQSPMLTFDTYNPIIHYYSSPTGSGNDPNGTLGGDYEFVFRSATEDEIILEGKKVKNTMRMTRVDESVVWEDYISSVNSVEDQAFLYTYHVQNGGETVGDVERSSNAFTYTDADKSVSKIPFIFTNDGLKFREALNVGGAMAQHFVWNNVNNAFECSDNGAENVQLVAYKPEGYRDRSSFIGSYTLRAKSFEGVDDNNQPTWVSTSYNVQLKAGSDESSLLMSVPGILQNTDLLIPIAYDRAYGTVCIKNEKMEQRFNDLYFGLCMVTEETGVYPYYGEKGYQLDGTISKTSPLTINFVSNTSLGMSFDGFGIFAYVADSYDWNSDQAGYVLMLISIQLVKK